MQDIVSLGHFQYQKDLWIFYVNTKYRSQKTTYDMCPTIDVLINTSMVGHIS